MWEARKRRAGNKASPAGYRNCNQQLAKGRKEGNTKSMLAHTQGSLVNRQLAFRFVEPLALAALSFIGLNTWSRLAHAVQVKTKSLQLNGIQVAD